MISILDYGAGNAGSVVRMVEKAGGQAQRIFTPAQVEAADKLIIPGVGAFDHGIIQLQERGLIQALHAVAGSGRVPVLGICLGMQLMCLGSEEGELPGLGWFNARVVKFQQKSDTGLRVPHMGWNTVQIEKPNALMDSTAEGLRFYFVHSYCAKAMDHAQVMCTTRYGESFVSALQSEQLYGVQFHPEKSHRFGLSLIKRFVDLKC